MKILLIEDDEILVAQLTHYLAAQKYLVEAVGDSKLGLEYAQATTYDLVLLDLHLPGEDGISLCRRLRQGGYGGAILMQTTVADSDHKVASLDAGADDYIVKPFSLEELSARIRALLRRPQGVATPILQWGELQLNPSTCQVSYANQPIALSPKEYNLLELFLRNPQRVFNGALLLERVWSFDESPGEETVRTHIKRLRQKLKQAGATGMIENIYGMGYRLKPPPAPASAPMPAPPDAASPELETQARQLATTAIHQFQDVILGRLAILDQAATAPVLSGALRQQAQQAAHKLVGSLGMFGLPDGSDLSRQIELALDPEANGLDRQRLEGLVGQLHRILQPVLPTTPSFEPNPLQVGQGAEVALPPSAPPRQGANLLVVSADQDWVQGLQLWALPELEIVHHRSLSQVDLSACPPAAILLDLATLDLEIAGLEPFSQQLASSQGIPVIVVTSTDSFTERLQISRHFTCTFLPRSLDPDQVLATVKDTLQRRCLSTVRLLAVDDDPVILQRLAQQLPQWGVAVTTLEDARQLGETLREVNPEVLLLDVEMPHFDGIQLCEMIRQDSRWAGLPILFLTACRTPDIVQRIYAAGGDDYIPKPFTGPELITRIFNRLERRPRPLSLPLTQIPEGLLTAPQAISILERDLLLAQYYQQPYCLGQISWRAAIPTPGLDALSQDTPSLAAIVNILKPRLRRIDVLTQFQLGTLTLGLYGVNAAIAHQRFGDLLDQLHQWAWEAPPAPIRFSYHLAIAPEQGTTLAALRQSLARDHPGVNSLALN